MTVVPFDDLQFKTYFEISLIKDEATPGGPGCSKGCLVKDQNASRRLLYSDRKLSEKPSQYFSGIDPDDNDRSLGSQLPVKPLPCTNCFNQLIIDSPV